MLRTHPFTITALAGLLWLLAGCSATPQRPATAGCTFPDSRSPAPAWVCGEPLEGVTVSAVGSAPAAEAGSGFTRQMASTDARVQLAQSLRVHVSNLIRDYVAVTGMADGESVDRVSTSVSQQITDETLIGSRIYRTAVAPNGSMYVLVGLDANYARELGERAIRSSMRHERTLWQHFQAERSLDELARAIANSETR